MQILCDELKKQGCVRRVIDIPVSNAFHSRYMHPVREKLKVLLDQADISMPQVNIVSNVTAKEVYRQFSIVSYQYKVSFRARNKEPFGKTSARMCQVE